MTGPWEVPQRLYHYTCSHSIEEIDRTGRLEPNNGFIWATDLYPPIRGALGLTSTILKCDRLAACYLVDPGKFVRWMAIRKEQPRWMLQLEESDGAMPMHWFVSRDPVSAVRLEEWAPVWAGR